MLPRTSRRDQDRSPAGRRSEIFMVTAAGISTGTPLVVARGERLVDDAAAVDRSGQVREARRRRCAEAAEIFVPENRSDMVRRFADKNRVASPRNAFAAVEHDGRRAAVRTQPGSVRRTNRHDVCNLSEPPHAQSEQGDPDGAEDPPDHAAAASVLARTIAARIKSAPTK